jgi:glutamate synthase domain-containing protein 2/glutamate synthase domain-containing protein 1/glutamate synthase domain-containing protein 3
LSRSLPPLYRPELERDACGVGLVADARGRRSRAVVERALNALGRLAHRGAARPSCPDGAGILTQIPWTLFARELVGRRLRETGPRMVGMFFWPTGAREVVAPAIEHAIRSAGWPVVCWREVPVDPGVLNPIARASQPEIWQAIGAADGPLADPDAKLHLARLRIERYTTRIRLHGFSVVSLSTSTLVYKGLVTPEQLPAFYPDLGSPSFDSALAIVHQRFSTNTAPEWRLAQPFRVLAHNGEINTIQGNRLWMRARARDPKCLGPYSGGRVVDETGSDSQSLDEVVELMRHSGFSLTHAVSRLLPPAWEQDPELPADVAAFYAYQACFSEPWDGPAAIAFTDGRVVGAALDRNGFRPLRYLRTADDQMLLGSEAGIFDVAHSDVKVRGRVGPGGMIAVDTVAGTIRETAAIRASLARQRPYARLLARAVVKLDVRSRVRSRSRVPTAELLLAEQQRFAYTREEIELILRVMAEHGEEAVGSMGDDTPPAALSRSSRILPDFFRQRFAQVTNPPMDPIREQCAMSLATVIGPRAGYLDESELMPERGLISLPSPILSEAQFGRMLGLAGAGRVVRIPLAFPADGGPDALEPAIEEVVSAAAAAVDAGARLLVLTDRNVAPDQAPIPALLGTAAVHYRLAARGRRMRVSLVVETGEARDPHQIATLFAYGAATVFPYLAYATIASLMPRGRIASGVERYRETLEHGLLKIFSKMGVSTFSGYCGGQQFEILGLDSSVVDRFFPGTPSPLGGLTLRDLAVQILNRQANGVPAFPGFHTYRRDGEYHANNPVVVRQLHRAAGSQSEEAYDAFARLVAERPPTSLRDLLEFRAAEAVPVDEVEPADEICRRFFASAMSVGALSPEAHRTIAIAMNRLGGRSNSGEGGEEPERFRRREGSDWAGSATKQIASARFGVTPAYLISADEIQIKIAQGSKPGEGGQLPAAKVVDHIARLRHAQAGITLISPPVHHDIYSIEDLAQLVFDLKRFHPAARIGVKLVAQTGVGIVAAGVVKAGADAVQISGHDGGTGASPRASIKHAGMPWELGLAEAQQVLGHHRLRDRVRLQVDGGLKIGRDVAIAAALGADEFGFGTAAVVAIGCVMARQCHLNTCPVGIATQRPDLRGRFAGTPDMLVAYFRLLAEDVRRMLARVGLRRLDDLIGRTDLLSQREAISTRVDLTPLLAHAPRVRLKPDTTPALVAPGPGRAGLDEIDDDLLGTISPERPLELCGTVRNTDRAVGAGLAGRIAARFGDAGLPDGSVRIALAGSAGQSFGAFLLPGMWLHLTGDANDYVGKGMHGGEIVIRPASGGGVIAGNTALYGATGGRAFIAGAVGERFAVRNSGATAVVEGVGDHACEYMTGGRVVVLGLTGRNFAAGMSGGSAFVLDPTRGFQPRCNTAMVDVVALDEEDWDELAMLLTLHHDLTSSRVARQLLELGGEAAALFWKIVPKGQSITRERDERPAFEIVPQAAQAFQ